MNADTVRDTLEDDFRVLESTVRQRECGHERVVDATAIGMPSKIVCLACSKEFDVDALVNDMAEKIPAIWGAMPDERRFVLIREAREHALLGPGALAVVERVWRAEAKVHRELKLDRETAAS